MAGLCSSLTRIALAPDTGAAAAAADADAGAGNSTPSPQRRQRFSYALCLLEEATPASRAGRQQFESFSCRLVSAASQSCLLPPLPAAAACFDVCTFAVRLVENPTNCLF